MSLSRFSFASLRTQKRAKSMYLNTAPEIEIDTSLIKQIGNYRLGEEIGSGAFGKVILGLHMITGERVAIKILDKFMLSQTPEDYGLVKQELNILKIVKHKYIVQLYEILETPQHIFIIMEYCEGQDILDYILTKGRLSENEALKYFQQLINALYYLHSQNITHRDIKIDNLLLDRNMDLKLIDFGLSTKYRDDHLLSQPCGTVVYAAPEVLDCREYHGMLADVWSSGIVLFGMLSGFLPFGDPDDEINKKLILQGNIELPHYFSLQARDLLRHMLDINPLTRYTLEEIMAHPWFNKNKFRLIPGIIIGINRIPVDEKIVNLCVTYNVDKNKVRDSVINNKFNTESALYYLLVKKLKACGNDSVSDFCGNNFIRYIIEESNKLDYLTQIQKIYEMNLEKEMLKEKIKGKGRRKIITQIDDYLYNNDNIKDKICNFNNTKETEIDLSAAPGLINDYNYNPKQSNYNLINIENNYSSSNSRNIHNSDKMNINEKDNSSMDSSRVRINLGETEFNKNGIENEDYFTLKNESVTRRIYTKGKMDSNILYMNYIKKNNNTNTNKTLNENININDGNRFNNSANNKKVERYINYKDKKKETKIENIFKIKKNSKKINNKTKPPLTSRNDQNSENNYFSKIYSTQISNIKKNKKRILPLQKEFYKKLNINKNKDNTPINFKQKNTQEKKEMLTKDSTKKNLRKSKISNPTINIPQLNIHYKNNKISLKKIIDKRKFINNNTNTNENVNEQNNKIIFNNKSIDSRNKLNNQKNNEINNNLFKTLFNKKIEKNILKNNQNLNQLFFKNKINSKSTESRRKFIIDSSSKDRKINKTNVLNLLDNFNLYQKSKKNINSNLVNSNKNNNTINKTYNNNTNKSTVNKNIKINYKKDFSYIQSPLTFDNNHFQEDHNKNNGFNTERTRNIYNLKKQSCFEKENNFTNSNNKKAKSKQKINNNNNNSHVTIKQNQKEYINTKIKEYYLKRKKINNLYIRDFNDISYSIGNNEIRNNTINSNINNIQFSTKANNNSNTINNDKYNNRSSRINVTLRNKSIKDRNMNNMHKKMNTSILSSVNKIKDYKKQKTKIINPKKIFQDNEGNGNKSATIVKMRYIANPKMKSNLSLSKDKNKNENKSTKNKIKRNAQHLESSVIVYRKKSPYKIRDLSDSPKQKYLNEKTRNSRIPWKIKKKGIDEKLDGISIYNRYINQFQSKNNNPFKKRNLLKKKVYNNKKEKNSSFLNNSKSKSNKFSLIPSSSKQRTLNISFSNYNNLNKNLYFKEYEKEQFNGNGTSHEFYKRNKNKNLLTYNKNKIDENKNILTENKDNKSKELTILKIKPKKQGKKFNIQRRNERSLNYNCNYNLTVNSNNNNSHIKERSNVLHLPKNLNEVKKKFNKSISFGSLDSYEKNKENKIEDPFDLSCLFITNKKINECSNNFGNKLKKLGMTISQKNNIINCIKNGPAFQITINKFNNNNILTDNSKDVKSLICYKFIDKKNRNNKFNEIFSKIMFNNK